MERTLKVKDDSQVGGDHYKRLPIEPLYFCEINGLTHCESNVIKYVCRHRHKNGKEDLRKAVDYLNKLIEINYEGDENE